jgi:hypothetical protein
MAEKSYGYGCWNAPCWFIGPEQGMGKHENDDLGRRIAAWVNFGKRELDDCRKFHLKIGELRWHGANTRIQATWGKLLLTYLAFTGKDKADRLDYQKTKWGCQPGETCVIELSGLAAHNLSVKRDRESFLEKRIQSICQNMKKHKPQFVVLYGKSSSACKRAWLELTANSEAIKTDLPVIELRRYGSTLLAWMEHPIAHGQTNENWTKLGTGLRPSILRLI